MSKFDDFLDIIQKGIVEIAVDTLDDFATQAIDDGNDFIEDTKEDLERWTKLLAKGELSKDDFTFLIQSQKDLFNLHALKQAGLALIAAQKFRDAVIDLMISAASKTFLS